MLRLSILVTLAASATIRNVISDSVPVRVVGREYYPAVVANTAYYDPFAQKQTDQIYLPESFGKPPQDRDVKHYYYGPVAANKYVTQNSSPPPPPPLYDVDVPPTTLIAPTETSWNPTNNPKLYYHHVPVPKVEPKSPSLDYIKKLNEVLKKQGKTLPPTLKQNAAIKPEFPIDKQTIKKLEKIQKKRAKLDKSVIVVPKKKLSAEAPGAESQRSAIPDKENRETRPKDLSKSGSHFPSGAQYSPFADSHGASAHGTPSNAKGERLIFHMAGHDGPMSYKWGYDTGKGHNRQFRFEERDKEGVIKGQFGYYDKEGKFRMMNYHAHPENGFHMEPIEHGLDKD